MTLGGLLRQQIEVLTTAPVSNGAGGWTEDWTADVTLAGQIVAASRKAQAAKMAGDAPANAEYAEAILHDPDGVATAATRFRFAGVTYDVVTADRQDQLAWLVGRRV